MNRAIAVTAAASLTPAGQVSRRWFNFCVTSFDIVLKPAVWVAYSTTWANGSGVIFEWCPVGATVLIEILAVGCPT
jgi:hypothetical protein